MGEEIPEAYRKPDYTQIAQLETELGLPHSAPAAPVLLTRDMILKAGHLRTEEVSVPEWGGHGPGAGAAGPRA